MTPNGDVIPPEGFTATISEFLYNTYFSNANVGKETFLKLCTNDIHDPGFTEFLDQLGVPLFDGPHQDGRIFIQKLQEDNTSISPMINHIYKNMGIFCALILRNATDANFYDLCKVTTPETIS